MNISIPSWEHPIRRFLDGDGEVLGADGLPYYLWEALLHISESHYPLRFGDTSLDRSDLVVAFVMLIEEDNGAALRARMGDAKFDRLVAACGLDARGGPCPA